MWLTHLRPCGATTWTWRKFTISSSTAHMVPMINRCWTFGAVVARQTILRCSRKTRREQIFLDHGGSKYFSPLVPSSAGCFGAGSQVLQDGSSLTGYSRRLRRQGENFASCSPRAPTEKVDSNTSELSRGQHRMCHVRSRTAWASHESRALTKSISALAQ